MTFSYLGYIWALLGCSLLVAVVGITGVALYLIGRRAERRAPRASVESVPLGSMPARGEGPPREAG